MFCFIRAKEEMPDELPISVPKVYEKKHLETFTDYLYYEATAQNIDDGLVNIKSDALELFDGVLVNYPNLTKRYSLAGMSNLLNKASKDESVLAEFYGQFRGVFLQGNRARFFVNQVRSLQLYFYESSSLFAVCGSLQLLYRILKAFGRELTADDDGLRLQLAFGYMPEDYSSITEIRSLRAGELIQLDCFSVTRRRYHRFDNEILHGDETKVLSVMDQLFHEAVRMGFEYDLNKGRKHLTLLSGGMDSRMTLFAALDLGFRDIHVLNFAQKGSADNRISKRICRDQKLAYLFYPLEGGNYLLQLGENAIYNDAQIMLQGAAHLYAAIQSLSLEEFGIIHSGQAAAFVMGGFVRGPGQIQVDPSYASYNSSELGIMSEKMYELAAGYPNNELFVLYNRGFNASLNGDYACGMFNHSVSPFMEPQFAQYMLNIDPALRMRKKLYRKWYSNYQPLAAKYPTDRYAAPIGASQLRLKAGRAWVLLMHMISHLLNDGRYHMNPFEYWWKVNPALRNHIGQHFKLSPELEGFISPELKDYIVVRSEKGDIWTKFNTYTVVFGLQRLLDSITDQQHY